MTKSVEERCRTRSIPAQTWDAPTNETYGPQTPEQLGPSGVPPKREELLARPSPINDDATA